MSKSKKAQTEHSCQLSSQNSANLSTTDEKTKAEDFDNDGWSVYVKPAALGADVSANDNYLPIDIEMLFKQGIFTKD